MNAKNARKLLFTVADVLEAVGAEYFLYGGTLLGAVRDGGFIAIDRDVDLAMRLEGLTPIARAINKGLIRAGLKTEMIDHRHKHPWSGGIFAIKFAGYGEHGDLSAFTLINGKRAIPSHAGGFWNVHSAEYMTELGFVELYGRMFPCPADVDGFLTEKYGDWRTPHTHFYNKSKPTCRKDESWLEGAR